MTETAISHGFAAGFQFIAAALDESGMDVWRLAVSTLAIGGGDPTLGGRRSESFAPDQEDTGHQHHKR